MTRKMTRKTKSARAKKGVKRLSEGRAPVSVKQVDVTETLVAAGAQALGFTLDPTWHASITFHLRLILRHAALVEDFFLPDDTEPAPVFHA